MQIPLSIFQISSYNNQIYFFILPVSKIDTNINNNQNILAIFQWKVIHVVYIVVITHKYNHGTQCCVILINRSTLFKLVAFFVQCQLIGAQQSLVARYVSVEHLNVHVCIM